MPGRLFLTRDVKEIWPSLASKDLDIGGPRHNISPGQQVLTRTETDLQMMRWGIIPVGRKNARGRPVMETIINARSETVFDKSAFSGVRRGVVPASGWYEWTGEKRKKTAWAIRPKDGDMLYFAAIYDVWTGPGGIEVPQVATVTCNPSADVRDIHHRMGVLLHPQDIEIWLSDDPTAAADLMKPYPDGKLIVSAAEDVDWTAP